eukprot:TRINITY_DN45639_c0_g1_i1.p1 TRINITY_DN45639_c0_g1~~TRINITY_DN45639_c0_g1_i1.p1  ORF type:complete len:890 (-),score=273.59 TRINITY_DN45639_c0_g1_i1:65-2734(-)
MRRAGDVWARVRLLRALVTCTFVFQLPTRAHRPEYKDVVSAASILAVQPSAPSGEEQGGGDAGSATGVRAPRFGLGGDDAAASADVAKAARRGSARHARPFQHGGTPSSQLEQRELASKVGRSSSPLRSKHRFRRQAAVISEAAAVDVSRDDPKPDDDVNIAEKEEKKEEKEEAYDKEQANKDKGGNDVQGGDSPGAKEEAAEKDVEKAGEDLEAGAKDAGKAAEDVGGEAEAGAEKAGEAVEAGAEKVEGPVVADVVAPVENDVAKPLEKDIEDDVEKPIKKDIVNPVENDIVHPVESVGEAVVEKPVDGAEEVAANGVDVGKDVEDAEKEVVSAEKTVKKDAKEVEQAAENDIEKPAENAEQAAVGDVEAGGGAAVGDSEKGAEAVEGEAKVVADEVLPKAVEKEGEVLGKDGEAVADGAVNVVDDGVVHPVENVGGAVAKDVEDEAQPIENVGKDVVEGPIEQDVAKPAAEAAEDVAEDVKDDAEAVGDKAEEDAKEYVEEPVEHGAEAVEKEGKVLEEDGIEDAEEDEKHPMMAVQGVQYKEGELKRPEFDDCRTEAHAYIIFHVIAAVAIGIVYAKDEKHPMKDPAEDELLVADSDWSTSLFECTGEDGVPDVVCAICCPSVRCAFTISMVPLLRMGFMEALLPMHFLHSAMCYAAALLAAYSANMELLAEWRDKNGENSGLLIGPVKKEFLQSTCSLVLICTQWVMWTIMVTIRIVYRRKLREVFGIKPDSSTCCTDVFVHLCCGSFALAQEARHVQEARLVGNPVLLRGPPPPPPPPPEPLPPPAAADASPAEPPAHAPGCSDENCPGCAQPERQPEEGAAAAAGAAAEAPVAAASASSSAAAAAPANEGSNEAGATRSNRPSVDAQSTGSARDTETRHANS